MDTVNSVATPLFWFVGTHRFDNRRTPIGLALKNTVQYNELWRVVVVDATPAKNSAQMDFE